MRCNGCKEVFHGPCLKFNNNTVFILQQFIWYCRTCINTACPDYKCETCFELIDIYRDKITQCKQCFKLLHGTCVQSNVCVSCLPLPLLDINSNLFDSNDNIECDFYSQQPYFAPFEFYRNNFVDFYPDADSLNDELQGCSELLMNCKYLSYSEFSSIVKDPYLAFFGLNIVGVRSNFDSFMIAHEKLRADGYLICESIVTEDESSNFYIPGYNKFVLDRILKSDGKYKQKGSGIIIYLHEKFFNVNCKPELNLSSPDFEALCVEVILKTEKIFLVCCYRSPSGNFDLFLCQLENLLSGLNEKKTHSSYIFGDFNVNLYNSESTSTRKYLDCIFSNNFLPIISRATHFGGLNGTCIDHILTSNVSRVNNNGIIRCNISRHLPVFAVFDYDMDNRRAEKPRNRVKVNDFLLQSFIREFESLNFNFVDVPAETCYSYFHENFRNLYDKWFINTKSNSSKCSILRSDWISIGVAKSSDIKNQLFDDWIRNSTKSNFDKFISYKRVFDNIKNKEKFDYYDRCFKSSQQDLKKTWKLINGLLGRKRSNKLLVFPNSDAAHNFNAYFVNVANDLVVKTYGSNDANLNDSDFKKYLPKSPDEELCDANFTSEDISEIISKLNNSKGTYFAPRILKILNPTLSPILAKLFNRCLECGYFPDELKVAKIIPLYKNKGSINEVSNYRPISMLSVFSKIFEKLIHKEFSEFFNRNNLFNDVQFGFRSKHSTMHALINAVENLHEAIDNKSHSLGIFIDFSRAFDTINYDLLLSKLNNYGVRGNFHNLIASYLTGRSQYVSYGGLESSLLKITCGIPQGSVLGPLLFIIFINDIVNVCDLAKYVLFADDLNLFLANRDRDQLYIDANEALYKIYEYCYANRLIMNFDKCCFIEFTSNNFEQKFLGILNKPFKQVYKCKFLGVFLNNDLSWKDQIAHVITQVSKSCGKLYSLRRIVPTKVLKQVYLSLVQPYLTYCLPLWGSAFNSSQMQALFILQKKCIRIVGRKTEKIDQHFQHTKPIFFRYKILTIFNLYYYFTSTVAMRIMTNNIPISLFKLFTVSERSGRLILPKFSLSKVKDNSFVFNASKILNYFYEHDIPYHILTAAVFKSRVKKHLLNTQNLSLEGDANWLPCNNYLFSNVIV